MPIHTCTGAQMMCMMGMAPSVFNATPKNVLTSFKPAGNIMDNKPFMNIPPFGMCQSPSNPTVAAATAAALGVLTPMPCVPMTPAPWAPGSSTLLVAGMPALNNTSTLACAWGGVIKIVNPGQFTEMIP
ncbi:DUF4280 domain-containing protein [Roseateles oligotrophus]|uniref:DUF4280 domain-containing protein n=1 Tax=Roseateles oligotrophus TaxID=1769250 RepID=A0ABT2YG61_9BURK|nr:DUF4280 domain-containing protein [Roseateles oligotrophus]MCV2369034.1 DUF4280 domain-containing protein [Roseateles oligotrophus]